MLWSLGVGVRLFWFMELFLFYIYSEAQVTSLVPLAVIKIIRII